MNVLALNAGSSSLKAQIFGIDGKPTMETPPDPQWHAEISIRVGDAALATAIRSLLQSVPPIPVDVVAHRVVRSASPIVVDAESLTTAVEAAIADAVELAPEHNAITLQALAASRERFPAARQAAAYDSAFHRTIPALAAIYAGPFEWFGEGFRKMGFHGLSHGYCARRAAQLLSASPAQPRIIVAHLGGGASLAAVHGNRSIDTTMGFTPLDGLMMATRSGSIDPGLLLYLLRKKRYTVEQLERVLNEESGLRGVSGQQSGDVRDVVAAMDKGDERSALAFSAFIYRLRGAIGAMAAALEGIDALVFTGGIGENSILVRSETSRGLGYLGINVDKQANAVASGDADISVTGERVRTLVIHTREEWEIARLGYEALVS